MDPLAADRLDRLIVGEDASIVDALRAIDRGVAGLALVVEADRRLTGVVTDGDLRRALIGGAQLEEPVTDHVRRAPITVAPGTGRAHVVDLMRARRIEQVPVVDEQGVVIGLHLLTDVIGPQPRANLAVVMAGGRGTRLGKLTEKLPKPMVPVAGRPILEWIVLHLVSEGIRDIVLSVGYLSEHITSHFGDGDRFGCRIRYVHDRPAEPRGSGGALSDIPRDWFSDHPVLVMNGDLLSQFDVSQLLYRHESTGAKMTVAVRSVFHEVSFGVVQTDADGMVNGFTEKPQLSWLVNAGIYVIDPEVIERVPDTGEYPLTDLMTGCLSRGDQVATWSLTDEWTDIGQPTDLARARGLTSG